MRQPLDNRRANRRLAIESLEARQMMTVSPALANFDTAGGFATEIEQIPSQGSVVYDATTRNVTVEGSESRDVVTIQLDTRSTAATDDDVIQVSLANTGKSLSAQYRVADVAKLVVKTLGGDDLIDNRSTVDMNAYAGAGQDVILGGKGIDNLLGGDGDDYLDGRAGSDSIWGERGVDALFGDDGADALFGGEDTDYLFGGNGADWLYGELGADRLYGGAGLDKLTDSGANTLYADYGPDNTVSASGFQAFDWFDRNLQDATLRSLARLQYRDGLLNRQEMFETYRAVAADTTVTTSEVADLKDLVSIKLNVQTDTRFFANKVANGDQANSKYQGSSLGNLSAGSADRLNKLVNKWFLGGDLPAVGTEVSGYAWVNGSLFVNGASYDDVRQGEVADCYLLSALGEVAQHSPSTLANMFADNGDGTFTVRFYRDGASQFVTVNRYLPVNKFGFAIYAGWGGAHANVATNELWVALAEKAYAQLNASGWIGQSGYNSYRGIDIGQSANAFKHITNKSATVVKSLSNSAILTALGAGKAITLATKDSGTASQIVANHEYMLIGYDPSTKKFNVYQPAGSAFKPASLSLSWSEITASFQGWTSVLL